MIAPTGLLRRYCTTDYHLALAHLMHNQEYVDFYHRAVHQLGAYVILDNSVIELGEPVEYEWLMRAVEVFGPSELVLCDFREDPLRTHKWATQYGYKIKNTYPNMKLMVVPQWSGSKRVEDWLESYHQLAVLPFVDVIGIPKFLSRMRPQICAIIDSGQRYKTKEYHLLGTWSNPIEIRDLSKYDWIRGCDSKIPVRLGQLGITLHPERGLLGEVRYELPPLMFDNNEDPMPVITAHNCKVFTGWARGINQGLAEVIKIGR